MTLHVSRPFDNLHLAPRDASNLTTGVKIVIGSPIAPPQMPVTMLKIPAPLSLFEDATVYMPVDEHLLVRCALDEEL
jgi:hypothetical protein